MKGSANTRKVLLFGLLGALGCLAGWMAGEVFLWVALPHHADTSGSLASRPELPVLQVASAPPAAPPPALPTHRSFQRTPAPVAAPPVLAVRSPAAKAPPAPPPPEIRAGKAPPPVPPPAEFAQRLNLANAKSGDVQLTLIWFNGNDLDLHCVEPGGEEIYFGHRRSRTGGELDVDMNAAGAQTTRPVENIYWPTGKSPAGKYRVYVNHYANHGGRDPSQYKVNVLANGRRQEYTGSISRFNPKRLICEFEVKPATPEFQLAVSPTLVVPQGGKNPLKVRCERGTVSGPITVRLDGDLRGLTPREFTLTDNQTARDVEISADPSAPPGDRILTFQASAGKLIANAQSRLTIREVGPELRLAVSPELIVHPGDKNHLKVRIERFNLPGPIQCRLEGDVRGLSPREFAIAADATEATIAITADDSATPGTRSLVVAASSERVKSEATFRLTVQETPPQLHLAAAPELIVPQGGSNLLPIRVARSNLKGPLQLHFEGDLRGITPQPTALSAAENETTVSLQVDAATPPGIRPLKVVATSGAIRAAVDVRLTIRHVAPALRLAVPGEIEIPVDGRNDLPVRIARERFSGEVTVRLDGEMADIYPTEFTIPANRDEISTTLFANGARAGRRALVISATAPGVHAEETLTLVVTETGSATATWSWRLVLVIGLWTGLLAAGLSLALVIGQNRVMARPWLTWSQGGLVILGAFAAGMVAGGMGQALYGLLGQAEFVPEVGFLAGWLLLGALLGRGLVCFIPNLSAWRATIAGSWGGLLGAAAFIVISIVGDLAGRLVGAACLGGAIGLMVALVESAFRKMWLEVISPSQVVRSVNLGATPVFIGGDAGKCAVFVPGTPGKALKFWEEEGQVYCLDVVAEKTSRVAPGYRRRLKAAEVVVCAAGHPH